MSDLIDKIQKRVDLADKNHVIDTEISVKVLRQVIEALKPVEELQAKVEELTGLLKAAACPNCNGDGAYYDNMGDVHQCQWCYETKAALKQEGE